MNLDLITDMFGLLDRHGYTRGDNEHTGRAILLLGDLARIYEGSQGHPFGPTVNQPPPQAEPAPPTPAIQNTVPVPIGEVKNLLVALDIAADYNRDRAELCADCADQSCPTCELRLREAQAYDRLYAQLTQQADASATVSSPSQRPSLRQIGRPASDPATRRRRTQPEAARLRDRRGCQRLDHRPVPGRRALSDPGPGARPEPQPRPRTRFGSRTVTLKINDSTMTSDQTPHTARQEPSQRGWQVSWPPGRTLDRNSAITAMILADSVTGTGMHEGHRIWPHIQGWAAELGLTGPDAVAAISQQPGDPSLEHEPDGGRLGREAAD